MARRDTLFDARRLAIEREGSPTAAVALRHVMEGTPSDLADPAAADLVATVARRPLALTDAQLDAARRAGHDDEALFELVCAAAVGEGLRRRANALRALRGERA